MTEKRRGEHIHLPETLADAKMAVLALPGAENYIPKGMDSQPEVEEGLRRLTHDVLWQLDSENMSMILPYMAGWQKNEAERILSEPELQPFSGRLDLSSNPQERRQHFLLIGTYLRLDYESKKTKANENQEEARRAADMLRLFHRFAIKNLFSNQVFYVEDKMNGFDPEERHDLAPKVSDELLERVRKISRQTAREFGVNESDLYQDVLDSSEGGSSVAAFDFLRGKKGKPEVRAVLERTIEYLVNDKAIQVEKLQLYWEAVKFSLEMGVDWKTFLQIYRFPQSHVIAANSLRYMLDPKNFLDLIKKAAPQSFERIKKGEVPTYFEIVYGRAVTEGYPDKADTTGELKQKWDRVYKRLVGISSLFDIYGFTPKGNYRLVAPVWIGATPRGYNINSHNFRGELVSFQILNPREPEDLFMSNAAHEATHFAHEAILQAGINKGVIEIGAAERVAKSVREDLAQMIAEQVDRIYPRKSRGRSQKERQGEFVSLDHAIALRRQIPYAIIQQGITKEMEMLWKKGSRRLSSDHAKEIIDRFNFAVKAWFSLGVPIDFPYHRATTNINILEWDDGLSYLSPETTEQVRGLREAFKQRFGRKWILQKEARIMLAGLLAETGTNRDYDTYAEFVRNADLDETTQKLNSWGIDTDKI